MSIHQQVKLFIETNRISRTEFALRIRTNTTTVGNIVNGKNNPSAEILRNMVMAYPNINANWLLTGDGPMFQSGVDSFFNEVKSLEIKLAAAEGMISLLTNQLKDKEKLISILERQLITDEKKNV